MPYILLHCDKNRRQDPYDQLDISLDRRALCAVGVDLNLSEQLHGFFPRRSNDFQSSKVAEIVFQDKEEKAGDYIPNQISYWHRLRLVYNKLAILTHFLDREVV